MRKLDALIRIHQYINNEKIIHLWRIVTSAHALYIFGVKLPSRRRASNYFIRRALSVRIYLPSGFLKIDNGSSEHSLLDVRRIWGDVYRDVAIPWAHDIICGMGDCDYRHRDSAEDTSIPLVGDMVASTFGEVVGAEAIQEWRAARSDGNDAPQVFGYLVLPLTYGPIIDGAPRLRLNNQRYRLNGRYGGRYASGGSVQFTT